VKQENEKTTSYASTLLRGLSILKCFSESNESLSVTELAKMTGIPQPTVWRFCQGLQSGGYLTTDSSKTLYRPGLALLGLGYSAISHFDLLQHARHYLVQLADAFKVVAGITSLDGLHMRVVDRHQAVDAVLSYNSRIGSSLPIASSASGWAYLASLGDAERQKLIARIAKEQSDLWRSTEPLFHDALVRYRKQGVIVSTGSFHRGITTVAIPISWEKSGATYPLYCSAISEAITDEIITQRLAPMMKKIAEELRVVLIAR
jgi:DNA-binding IclR family transcriptional regulator